MAPEIRQDVARALAEDIGTGDVTSRLVPSDEIAHARVVTREPAVLSGEAWFEECFHQIDREVDIRWHAHDGDRLASGQVVCEIDGRARSFIC